MSIIQTSNLFLLYFISTTISVFGLGDILRNSYLWKLKIPEGVGHLSYYIKGRADHPLYLYIAYAIIAFIPIFNLVVVLYFLIFAHPYGNCRYPEYGGIYDLIVEWRVRFFLRRFLIKLKEFLTKRV